MLNELVLTGDGPFLEKFIKEFNAEQEQKAHAYDMALWKEIMAQGAMIPRPPAEADITLIRLSVD